MTCVHGLAPACLNSVEAAGMRGYNLLRLFSFPQTSQQLHHALLYLLHPCSRPAGKGVKFVYNSLYLFYKKLCRYLFSRRERGTKAAIRARVKNIGIKTPALLLLFGTMPNWVFAIEPPVTTGFKVVAGHPRIYLNQEHIQKIRAAASGFLPFYNTGFPQSAGVLAFDIKPAPQKPSNQYLGNQVFDTFDNNRNHVFIRHIDEVNPGTGLTSCNTQPDDNQTVCMQIALQSNKGFYVAALNFPLSANQWQKLTIAWNATSHTASLKIDNTAPKPLKWKNNGGNTFYEWRPDQQHFVFAGGDGLDNIRLGSLKVTANSILTDAWSQFYGNALAIASLLNHGKSPVDARDGHPEIARVLGLAYLVTEDKQFLSAALAYANRLLAVVPRDSGGDYFQAFRIEAMGIIYDWLFSAMNTINSNSGRTYGNDLATAILETIKFQGEFICGKGNDLTTDWRCRSQASPDALSGHSYSNNTGISTALLAIIGEHMELSDLLYTEYLNFVSLYNPVRAWLSIDGGSHMGWGYGAVYSALDSIQLWDNAITGAPSMKAAWQGKLIDRFIYGLRGDLTFPTSGDSLTRSPADELVATFALTASRDFGNRPAQHFYNRWILPSANDNTYRLADLLYWEPSLQESSIDNLDYSRWFRNAGQVLMRDTWDYPKATLLEFKSTSFWSQNHHHLDQNAFTLFYKAPLLVDSGIYDDYNSEHWRNYFIRTIAHNTLTVWDPSESFGKIMQFAISNDGGQKIMPVGLPTLTQIQEGGSNHLDGIVRYEYTPDITYVVGNASKAYSDAKLDQSKGFLRSIVFLRHPDFWGHPVAVVFDQVTAKAGKAGLKKRFLLHCVHEPEPLGGESIGPGQYLMKGDTLTIRNGRGMLFSQTLLPENPALIKIGGVDTLGDHRFLVENMDQSGKYQLQNFPPNLGSGKVNADMGAWRIEVTAPVHTQKEYFLHVLSVAYNGATSMPPIAQNLSSDNAAVALLDGSQIIAFSKSENAVDQLSWDMPVANAKMFIAGLLPDTLFAVSTEHAGTGEKPYRVTVVKSETGAFRTSPQGTLTR
jgi:hypothetical protein